MAKTKPSLFGAIQKTTAVSEQVNGEFVRNIPVDKLLDNPLNRFSMQEDEAFARSLQSVEQDGLWEDILVTPAENGCYRIISGHRRKRIAQKLGMTTVPCKVRTYDSELDEARALIGENIHRRSVTPIDMARQLDTLCQVLDRAGLPDRVQERVQQLIEQTGLSRATILRYLDLLRLSEPIVAWIEQGALPMTDAYFLAQKNHCKLQEIVVQQVESMDADTPLEARIQTALANIRQGKDHAARPAGKPAVNPTRAVRKCRTSVRHISTELDGLRQLEHDAWSQVGDPKALQADLDSLTADLQALLDSCRTLRAAVDEKNLT